MASTTPSLPIARLNARVKAQSIALGVAKIELDRLQSQMKAQSDEIQEIKNRYEAILKEKNLQIKACKKIIQNSKGGFEAHARQIEETNQLWKDHGYAVKHSTMKVKNNRETLEVTKSCYDQFEFIGEIEPVETTPVSATQSIFSSNASTTSSISSIDSESPPRIVPNENSNSLELSPIEKIAMTLACRHMLEKIPGVTKGKNKPTKAWKDFFTNVMIQERMNPSHPLRTITEKYGWEDVVRIGYYMYSELSSTIHAYYAEQNNMSKLTETIGEVQAAICASLQPSRSSEGDLQWESQRRALLS